MDARRVQPATIEIFEEGLCLTVHHLTSPDCYDYDDDKPKPITKNFETFLKLNI